ncbi:hypothetical protein [Bradyrhizobium betae]|uniref:Uncharacterized protein n=1 Tax=Bradyrhizobium betae TaxID=244734 RepID=A0A5P6P9K2_9BRAD|nr:hypothetical protein [Bradyrhizobium betae]MCS3727007.1 hypothetical protein [Bradyrhizobium betae]QFI75059.1 hypothetical protein F8237_23235 [Bradyrhizobium betae]
MLPGFRFLFAAILLSTSILVFGLGAAALLRASHEQYVSNPSWRNGPQEQVFAQAPEPALPVLAALRAEPDVAEPAPSVRDLVPTIGLPASDPEPVAAATTETAAQPQVAEAPSPTAEPAKSDSTTDAAAPAPADTLTPADTTASIPEARPASTEMTAAAASSAPDTSPAKFAALNDPATTAWKDPPAKAKADISTPDAKATKRKAKAKKRHRIVRRPPPQQLQQQLDPFGQPQTFATTPTPTRR